jgi:hypothetical protein
MYMNIYIHVPKAKRTKLEHSRNKDTFVGYIAFHMDIDCEKKKAPKMSI